MPLFTKAEMNKNIENRRKRLGSKHHSVPTSWKKGKTFLEEEYLKNIECTSDESYFYFRCKCYHSFRKNDEPHSLKLILSILGSLKESKEEHFGIKWPKIPIKALGVYLTYDQKLIKEKNFIERLDSIKKLINI